MRKIKTCRVRNCKRKIRALKLCIMHYQRQRKTGVVGGPGPRKSTNGTYTKTLEGGVLWTNKESRRNYRRVYRMIRRKEDPDSLKSIHSMHKKRFGGLRQRVLIRDGYTCRVCGMTNREHKERWGCEITIDHLDGTEIGRA